MVRRETTTLRVGRVGGRRLAGGLSLSLGLALLLLLPVACGEARGGPASGALGQGPSRRSVIFILIDTLRADHTSISGHRNGRRTTPFLERLAEESVVFERAYVPASWTRASMASIFTSRIPASHGCETRDGRLVDEMTTWVEVLHDEGYETRGVFTNGNLTSHHGFAQGFDQYTHVRDHPRNAYADGWKVREPALEALDRSQDPFLLYLHYVDPHDPYVVHGETDYSPHHGGEADGSREYLDRYRWKAPEEAEDRQRVIDLYDGEIQWFDKELEILFDRLDRRGVLDESWVVITSDHGEGLWDHRIQAHGQEVFEEQLLVPFVMRPPGGGPGLRVEERISLIDLGPTLLDLLGVGIPREFEGESWAPFLRGRAEPPVRPIIVDEEFDNQRLAAIIDGDDKLIVDLEKNVAVLFDLASNPTEDLYDAINSRNVHSDRANELERELRRVLRDAEGQAPADATAPVEELPQEILENLRALGYLGDEMPDEEDG